MAAAHPSLVSSAGLARAALRPEFPGHIWELSAENSVQGNFQKSVKISGKIRAYGGPHWNFKKPSFCLKKLNKFAKKAQQIFTFRNKATYHKWERQTQEILLLLFPS